MKRALAYIRVSSDTQEDNTSLENQRRSIIIYAKNFGFDVCDWFQDVESGSDENREGLSKLRQRVKKGDCSAVIVYKVDRFTRSVILGSNVRKEIEESGCTLVSVSEAFDATTSIGRMMLNILQTFAEFERDTINTRFKVGRERKVRSCGAWLGGTPPIGFKAVGSRKNPAKGLLEIDEAGAASVRACFDLRKKGMSLLSIARAINELGYKTSRGFQFTKATVSRILKRENVYNGITSINSSYELENCNGNQPKII